MKAHHIYTLPVTIQISLSINFFTLDDNFDKAKTINKYFKGSFTLVLLFVASECENSNLKTIIFIEWITLFIDFGFVTNPLLVRAKRPQIEEALTFLLEENEPNDNDIGHYRQTIDRELKKMLNVGKNVFSKKWYKDRVRKSFDDYRTQKKARIRKS